jgi:hypothetical protein
MADLRCINGPAECAGPVEMRTTSDRTDGKHFARCLHHFELRQASAERSLELDARGRQVDPSYAGERYEEDV